MRFDLTSVGSTMIRLSVPPGERLETAPAFQVHTAGTESNTLAAAARMGLKTAWVSRLTHNSLGRRVAGEIRRFGVDVSGVVWTEAGRQEVFFVEYGPRPRGIQVIYDRRDAAVERLQMAELDLGFILDTRIFHLTGILPALGPGLAELSADLMAKARAAGVETSFDLNFRAKLWSPAAAAEALAPLMARADLLLLTQEDAAEVLGFSGDPEEVVRQLHREFQPRAAVLTLGRAGAAAFDGREVWRAAGHEVEVVDRLGAGDCFTAGVILGWLEGSLAEGLRYGLAMAALKLGIRGDYFVSDRAEVARLLNAGQSREVGR